MLKSDFRTEKDSLGEIQIPLDALYGAQTQRAVENFPISARRAHPELLRAYLQIKSAASTVNEKLGTLDSERASLIRHAVDELLAAPEKDLDRHFPVDVYQAGAGTSQNMNVNEVIAHVANRLNSARLASRTSIHANDHVNRSQSTNDSFPTALRMALVDAGGRLAEELRLCAATFEKKGRLWYAVPKAARTHLIDAVPMRLGQEARAWSATCARLANWIEQGRDACRELGIGGSAAGTGLNVPSGFGPAMIAALSDATAETYRSNPDLHEAMQSQAPVGFYSAMLKLMALELTRICNDLRLLASGPLTGLGELRLPAVQPGSSIMPGKVNPSMLEMANQTWFSVLGFDQTVSFALQAGQLELNVMMPIMAYATIEATRISTHALRALRVRCLEGLEANEPRLRLYYESTPQLATVLTPRLGYERTAQLVKESLATGRPVTELVRARGLIPEEELAALIDPEKVLGK